MKYKKMFLLLVGVTLVLAGCSTANEDKEEVQAILDMMALSGTNFTAFTNQGIAQRIGKLAAMAIPADKTRLVQFTDGFPITVQIPLFNEPLDGFGGTATVSGNFKITIYESGQFNGDFMVKSTFDRATWDKFEISGSLSDAGTITGNAYSGSVSMDWNTSSGFDFQVNKRNHSVLLTTSITGTAGGVSGRTWGIIDSETYSYNF